MRGFLRTGYAFLFSVSLLSLSSGALAATYRIERSYPEGGPKLGKETIIEFKIFRGKLTTPLTAKDLLVEHEKLIHMMTVDSGFQKYLHEHPVEVSSGVWRVPVLINTPGAYRFFLQFLPDGEITTKTVVFDDRYVVKPEQIVPSSPAYQYQSGRDAHAIDDFRYLPLQLL